MGFKLIGRGVYTLAEAQRLTGIPSQTIRRWTQGYTYRHGSERRYTPPVIATEVQPTDGTPALDFADLIEVRFLEAFRKYGVGWRAIRIAAQRAKELLGRHRPFSTKIFRTDGRTVLAEIVPETGDRQLLDLVRDQYQFERIIAPYLYAGLDFNRYDEAERWWPLGRERLVVLDPVRSLGAPIVATAGVQTRILADAYRAEQSFGFVAEWYDVPEQAVRDAVEFEAALTG